MMSDVIEKAAPQIDADAKSAEKLANGSPTPTSTPGLPTVYFTDGEMLPWKGRWFRVRLREIQNEKLLTLVEVKPTESAIKKAVRSERWLKQHPRSQRAEIARFKTTVSAVLSAQSALASVSAS